MHTEPPPTPPSPQPPAPTGAASPNRVASGVRVALTALASGLVVLGTWAIVSETHTGSSRLGGLRTLTGADAIWFGRTCLLLAVLPLLIWLPERWLKAGLTTWWLGLMAWLLGPFFWR